MKKVNLKRSRAPSFRIYYQSKSAINTALFNVDFLQEKNCSVENVKKN